jgi:ATP-binding cassette subfamily F protein 3
MISGLERDERVKIAKAEYEANIREIERLQSFVDRFGAKTMGASMAQSRLKTIEKIESTMTSEAPTDADRPPPSLVLPRPPRGSKVLLEMKNAVISWVPKQPLSSSSSSNEVISTPAKLTPIINDCTVTIERGMRIAVRGPNGAGK